MNQHKVNETASRFLGKQLNDYQTSYDPNILVPIERNLNRQDYGITNEDFGGGYDIWHNYECSFLTNKGYPVSLVGKIKIPLDSPKFIESKSMKLYFFSFHMEKLGETVEEAIENYVNTVTKDLSEATESQVEFAVFKDFTDGDIFEGYEEVSSLTDIESLEFNTFKETADFLKLSDSKDELKVVFRNVRSNCRVTHQPDFANLFLRIKGDQPTVESVLQYIVSFRNEYHFHEEVTEQIFKNIKERFNPSELSVSMLFTRRGGLDICPVRASSIDLVDQTFLNVNKLPKRTVYQ